MQASAVAMHSHLKESIYPKGHILASIKSSIQDRETEIDKK